jgi:integrative and conjugative element protein (TIGR02256 family)
MSKWFERHASILYSEVDQLASNSSYEQQHQVLGSLLVTAGNILIRLNGKVERFPIAIIYADATPYALPGVFMLQEPLTASDTEFLAKMAYDKAAQWLQPKAKFYFRRHQNFDGSLCLLEQDNLEQNGAELYDANSVISRVHQWLMAQLMGTPVPESTEVELYAHYRYRLPIQLLLTDAFYDLNLEKGQFYIVPMFTLADPKKHVVYLGAGIVNQQTLGTALLKTSAWRFMPPGLETPQKLVQQSGKLKEAIKNHQLVEGYWWQLPAEPPVFADTDALLLHLGAGDLMSGEQRATELLWKTLRRPKGNERIYIGLRFPNRRGEAEWVMLALDKASKEATPDHASPNVRRLLQNYVIQSCHTEAFRARDYHLRNSGRVAYDLVHPKAVTVLGCGALGSEIADSLGKAGVGHLHFIDNQVMYPHNSVRHLAGYRQAALLKIDAVAQVINDHNNFVELSGLSVNVLRSELPNYMFPEGIGISSIADDNTEAYLNEQALEYRRTIFYARALRGGKAARIFRVIPGQDACFHCLTLYRRDKHADFLDVLDDEALPTLRNECNNPIRPASAADLKLIAALTSRLLLDHLQSASPGIPNHWVWTTETLLNLPVDASLPFALAARTLAPHASCPYCQALHAIKVKVEPNALALMQQLTSATPGIETGGVLMGVVAADGTTHILVASEPGPKAVRSATRFERDVEFCQRFVDEHTAAGLQYLGEWHSHPGEDNSPSTTDLTSLAKIAQQPQYLTTKPVMVIFTRSGSPSCTVHPVSAVYYPVNLDVLDKAK